METQTKYMRQLLQNIGQQAQDCGPWKKGNKQGLHDRDASLLSGGSFQDIVFMEGQSKQCPVVLPSWGDKTETREAEASRIYRAEYQKGGKLSWETDPDTCKRVILRLWLSTTLWIHGVRLLKARKRTTSNQQTRNGQISHRTENSSHSRKPECREHR